MSLYARLAFALLIVVSIAAAWWKVDRMFAAAEQRGYDRRSEEQTAADLNQARVNARETLRRMEAQHASQQKQNAENAAARADAERNRADADRLREQNASLARRWSTTLGNSPTVAECAAAGGAITVQADVLGRVDRAAGELAAYADAARAAGSKCERDYQSLTK